jgi:hypothetical protein
MKTRFSFFVVLSLVLLSVGGSAENLTVNVTGSSLLNDGNNCAVNLIHNALLKYEGLDFTITEPKYGPFETLEMRVGRDLAHAEVNFVATNKSDGSAYTGTFVTHIATHAKIENYYSIKGYDVSCWPAATSSSCNIDDVNYSLYNMNKDLVLKREVFHAGCAK